MSVNPAKRNGKPGPRLPGIPPSSGAGATIAGRSGSIQSTKARPPPAVAGGAPAAGARPAARKRSRSGPQLGRPLGRDERPSPRFEPAQPVAVDDVDRSHDPGLGGQPRPAREALRVGRSVPTSNRRRVGLQPEEGQRDLAVELPRDLGRAGACPGSQPRRVGLSDLPEPAVLQRREDREEHRERDRPQQERPMGPPGSRAEHVAHSRPGSGPIDHAFGPLTLSYFLTRSDLAPPAFPSRRGLDVSAVKLTAHAGASHVFRRP